MIYNILDYGAIADGNTLATEAIQKAINACGKAGGGRVLFPKGEYRSGAISLMDNIELYFEQGAKLIASNNIDDFDLFKLNQEKKVEKPTWENCDYDGRPTKYFIYGKGLSNISIDGEGIIDGNEEIFYGEVSKYHIDGYFYPRVPLIYFEDCLNVSVYNVTLQKSAFWTVHLVGCKNVEVDSVKILNNLRLANSDGIDPDHCQNVIIRNCHIESADDCIVLKTTEANKAYGACENIEVRDCVLISTSAAIKFGTETCSDIKDVLIHDCRILNSNRGISFMLRDEGNIDRVVFKNIAIHTRRFAPEPWWGKAEPIAITAVRRNESTKVGKINNILFENIVMASENGIFIYGDEDKNITNISFNNISIELSDKTNWTKNMHDLRPSCVGEIIETPLTYFYIRNADTISLNNYKMHAYTPMDDLLSAEFDVENVECLNK